MTVLEQLKAGLEYCNDDPEVEAQKERTVILCRGYSAIVLTMGACGGKNEKPAAGSNENSY